ncbi:MAG: hypothetical protein ACO3EZ_11305 [Prochlorotrichaceae cyanobacterium]
MDRPIAAKSPATAQEILKATEFFLKVLPLMNIKVTPITSNNGYDKGLATGRTTIRWVVIAAPRPVVPFILKQKTFITVGGEY